MDSGELSISAAAHIADLPEEEQQEIVQEEQKEILAAATKIRKKNTHVGKNSGENEWHTPSEYIDTARILSATGEVKAQPFLTGATVQGEHCCIYPARSWWGCMWEICSVISQQLCLFCSKTDVIPVRLSLLRFLQTT